MAWISMLAAITAYDLQLELARLYLSIMTILDGLLDTTSRIGVQLSPLGSPSSGVLAAASIS